MSTVESAVVGNQIERELKLEVDDAFGLPDFTSLNVEVEDLGTKSMTAVYWDTTDLRLARAHYGVRHRTDKAWTVKGPSRRAHQVILERSEQEFDGPSTYPPAAVVARVRSAVGNGQLQPVIQVDTQRHRVGIRRGDAFIDLAHDRVNVSSNGTNYGGFVEVELELVSGSDDLALELVEFLKLKGARTSKSASKYIHALQLAGRWR